MWRDEAIIASRVARVGSYYLIVLIQVEVRYSFEIVLTVKKLLSKTLFTNETYFAILPNL